MDPQRLYFLIIYLILKKYTLKQQCSKNCSLNNTNMPEDLFIEKKYYSVVLKKDMSGALNIKGFTRNYDVNVIQKSMKKFILKTHLISYV